MDYQFEEVDVREPLDIARIDNNTITQPDGRNQKELRQQQRTSKPQQAINGKRKKSKSQQDIPSEPLRASRILRLVKRLTRENRALQAEVERFAHENQALRTDVNERDKTIEMLQEGLQRLSGEAVALVQNSGLAHGRGSLVRDQPSFAPSVSESPVSAPHLYSTEQNEISPDISHNGYPLRHREHGEPGVKQELDEGEDAIDAGDFNDHDRYDQEHHEYGSATEQAFEGFENDSQNEELDRRGEDAQRGDSNWQTEREGSVDMDEEQDTEDDPSHQVQEKLNYSIDDIGSLWRKRITTSLSSLEYCRRH
ncbi:hypothetical protein CB0940_11318 [Cercospora beticola]|uniref:Uncharacterized protein n=1 Tax=Cercospora beticola TaxID=122368 RepID=A0A2G5HCM6_CERBT|nr:hypothetical protein CB0940_11318 [Cercospora beticola]PIA90278.1 hypothetical protein CB0940_11318 [Cercospora beticola]WPB08157.1 hypothetical protein RHO25_012821 [Cercospora beticola]